MMKKLGDSPKLNTLLLDEKKKVAYANREEKLDK